MVQQALSLGPDQRVVMLHVTRDPDRLHVTVEGPGVSTPGKGGAEWERRAWSGEVSAPGLPWPPPAGPPPTVEAEPVAVETVTVNACRVDEGGDGDPAAPRAVQDPGAYAVGQAWEAANEAIRCGVAASTVLTAVEDAVVEALKLRDRSVRREVLLVVDRLRSLLVDQEAEEQRGGRGSR